MPIYEYRCKECQQVFEEWSKHVEDAKTRHTCPICRGEAERLISHTSFALKGSGWYVTEYGTHKGMVDNEKSASIGGAASTATESKGDAGAEKSSDAPAKAPTSV
jgi:putative FmdB family regulatory protein